MEPLRREVLSEMVGDPETLLVDSTLVSVMHPLLRFLRARASLGRRADHQDLKAKICAYTYAFMVNRMLGRPQGHIKELWA
jgi:hypothetical protein